MAKTKRDWEKAAKILGNYLDERGWEVWQGEDPDEYKCPKCNHCTYEEVKFCSQCVAKMAKIPGGDTDTTDLLIEGLKLALGEK